MSFAIFINYLEKRKPELWKLFLVETYKADDQITVKLDRTQGKGQIKFIILEPALESFIEALRKAQGGVQR